MNMSTANKFVDQSSTPVRTLTELAQGDRIKKVFGEAIKDWPAWRAWQPSDGGLSYLKGLAGDALVEVMASPVGSGFYGAIGQHERLEVTFGVMVDRAAAAIASGSEPDLSPDDDFLPTNSHLYLAQAAMMDSASPREATLSNLLQDVIVPSFLPADRVGNVNLWMSVCGSRSNTHYDHFHNLLCAVAGSRQVTLWPPSATPSLYPMPLYGEASNHSSVDFAAPDHANFPLYANARPVSQLVVLHPGDALFIPEGWWHQVNTEGVTLAVNMWWPSAVSLTLESGGHMAAYYARKAVCILVEQEKARLLRLIHPYLTQRHHLPQPPPPSDQDPRNESKHTGEDTTNPNTSTVSHTVAESLATESLAEREEELLRVLVLTVADCHHTPRDCSIRTRVNLPTNPLVDRDAPNSVEGSSAEHVGATRGPPTSGNSESMHPNNACSQMPRGTHSDADEAQRNGGLPGGAPKGVGERDVVASVLAALPPYSLRKVLLSMVNDFPVTLESLILRHLSPMAAELLTLKMEGFENDRQANTNDTNTEEGREGQQQPVSDASQRRASANSRDFFATFYGVFRDPSEALATLLEKKERFGREALNNVMRGVLDSASSERQLA